MNVSGWETFMLHPELFNTYVVPRETKTELHFLYMLDLYSYVSSRKVFPQLDLVHAIHESIHRCIEVSMAF